MTFATTLRTIVDALDAAGIPHMVDRSVASARHGEPRSTVDIDIVIDPARSPRRTGVRAAPPLVRAAPQFSRRGGQTPRAPRWGP
jgi:hypothetical protein